MAHPERERAKGRPARYAAYSAAVVVAFFLILEIAARALLAGKGIAVGRIPAGVFPEDANWARPSLRLAWTGRPDHEGEVYGTRVRLNARGHRAETLGPRARGAVRVAFLGDSRTFGFGVDADATFAAATKDALRRLLPDRPVDVYNAGVPGYTAYQGLVETPEVLDAADPTFAVFAFGFNDRRRANLAPDSAAIMAVTGAAAWANLALRPLRERSALLSALFLAAGRAAEGRRSETPRVDASAYARDCTAFARLAAGRGVVPVVLSLRENPRFAAGLRRADEFVDRGRIQEALPIYLADDEPVQAILARRHGALKLRAAGHAGAADRLRTDAGKRLLPLHGGPLVVPEPPYLEFSPPADLAAAAVIVRADRRLDDEGLFLDFCHLNADGNRVVGRMIADAVAERLARTPAANAR
jgi:lysophospholipase L1-like esterase